MVVVKVPANGVWAGVESCGCEGFAQGRDQLNGCCGSLVRVAVWSSGAGLERGLALGAVAGDEFGHPTF